MKKNKSQDVFGSLVSSFSPKTLMSVLLLAVFGIGFAAGFFYAGRDTGSHKNPSEISGFKVGKYDLSEVLSSLGVDAEKAKSCLDSGRYKDKVNSQLQEGSEAGIRGTPGGVLYDRQTSKMVAVPGAVPVEALTQLLSDLKNGKNDPQAPKVQAPDPEKDHWRGSKDARYVLVEYSDFECPYCQRFHPTAKQFEQENEDLAWVYRHFPIRTIHPDAQKLAELSECVVEQKGPEGFWQFSDLVFEKVVGK